MFCGILFCYGEYSYNRIYHINCYKKNDVTSEDLGSSFYRIKRPRDVFDRNTNTKVKISKLAQGLPVGGEIEFLDDGTLFSAFKNRGPVVGD